MNSSGRTNKNIGIGPLQTALLARSKNKLETNESELTELRKLVDAGKGGVPVSQLLSSLDCQTKNISGLGGTDNNVLQKLEEAIPKKEDEYHKGRELVAEAKNNHQGSAPRNPAFVSSVLPTRSSNRRSSLRKLVDAGEGGVPVSQLLSNLGCQTDKISGLVGTDNNVLQKLEAAILKKEDECHKARELVAEANSNQQGSAPQNPAFASSVLPTQSSKRRSKSEKISRTQAPKDESSHSPRRRSSLSSRRSSLSSRNENTKETQAPESRDGDSEEGRRVPTYSITSDGILIDESSHSTSEKKSETRAPEIRRGASKEARQPSKRRSNSEKISGTQGVPKYSITSDGILIDEISHSSRSKSSHSPCKKKSETRAPEIRGGASKEGRHGRKNSKASDELPTDESSQSSRSKKKAETRAPGIRSDGSKERRHSRKSSKTTSDFLMDDCHEARKLIAEASRNQQGSTHQDYPVFLSPVLPTKSSHSLLRSESSHSSRNLKESVTQALEADMCEKARELASIGIVIEF
jgi:hypothetical protein